jgi:hypothetical protein
LNTETITDTSQSKHLWWIKFDQETGKIFRISPKPLKEDKHRRVVASHNTLCKDIVAGKLAVRDCGMIWDMSQETWDIDKKSDVLVLKELGSQLLQIPHANPFACDIFVRIYKKQNVIEISVDAKNIKNSMNLSDINQIANTEHTLLNLYFTRKNDPDYLIESVEVDPVLLFKKKKIRFKVDTITKHADWDNISIFTRPIFKNYGFEIQDTIIESDYNRNIKTILQRATSVEDAHIYLSVKDQLVTLNSTITIEQDYLVAGQKDLKFLVCDSIIDNIVGGFGVSSQDIVNMGRINVCIDFEWPKNALVVYKNKQLLVSYVGETNG